MLRTVSLLLQYLRRLPWSPPPAWLTSDARALASFLTSATGQKLTHLLTSEIAAAHERAALSKGSAYECGWACGFRGLLAWFHSLSASAPAVTGDHHETTPGSAEELAHLAP